MTAQRGILLCLLTCALACSQACGSAETTPTTPTDETDEGASEPADEAGGPVTNIGDVCTSDGDCAGLEGRDGFAWRCQVTPGTPPNPDGPSEQRCQLTTENGDLYCQSVEDCPPPRRMAAYIETASCESNRCTYSGNVTQGREPGGDE